MKIYLAEFIGTFAIVFCGTGAIIINEVTHGTIGHVGVAVTFGLIVMTMIYALGPISGAHFNPAVTVAFATMKTFPVNKIIPYFVSQFGGAIAASLVLKILFPTSELLGVTMPMNTSMQAFIMEIILSFFLVLVILQVAQGSKEQGMFAGLAIGSVVLLEAMFAGPVSGASMNPARSLAPAIVSRHFTDIWVYLAAPFIGALVAVLICKFFKGNQK